MPALQVTAEDVPDDDWAARSQATLTAVRAGAFIVAPPWDIPAPVRDATLIVVEPSMGFGTGHHATTRLCLRLLSAVEVTGRRTLDLGTGSGVLAMGAALKGAREVEGVDVDPDAIASARRNARLNALPIAVQWRIADFRAEPLEPADVVLANLTGGLLTSAAPALVPLVRRGGALLVGGMEISEAGRVRRAFGELAEAARLEEANWVALVLRRQD
jgi:ribosomal protein L11 methyltransferase